MSGNGSVTRLLPLLRGEDVNLREQAVDELWRQYGSALLRVAATQLTPSVKRREDEHDIVQSAFHSFCRRQRAGAFELDDRSDLWSVLVMITMRKASNARVRHQRRCRDHRRETSQRSNSECHDGIRRSDALAAIPAPTPSPVEALEFQETLERLLGSLPDHLRQVAVWKLAGYTNEEIAAGDKLNCTVRTVERKLNSIRTIWAESNADDAR